jgi:hypothetical protein
MGEKRIGVMHDEGIIDDRTAVIEGGLKHNIAIYLLAVAEPRDVQSGYDWIAILCDRAV